MKFIIVFILLSIVTVNPLLDENEQIKFIECEEGPYPNTITNFLISPDPLVIGQSASYTFNGTRNVEILEGSTIQFLITDENSEIVFEKIENFCSAVTTTNEKCPLPIGDYEFTYGFNSIGESSSENVDKPLKSCLFHLSIKDPKGNFLSCIRGLVSLSYVSIASSNDF